MSTTDSTATTTRAVWLDGVTLQVDDVERSLAFYRQIPGAVLEHHRPGEFALLRLGEARLGLLAFSAPGFHLEMSTGDVDALHQAFTNTTLQPLGPPLVFREAQQRVSARRMCNRGCTQEV